MLMTADLYRPVNLYFFLIFSCTRRLLDDGSSLTDTLSFNKPTITSKILFTFLRKSVSSSRASSVSEIRYSVLVLKFQCLSQCHSVFLKIPSGCKATFNKC